MSNLVKQKEVLTQNQIKKFIQKADSFEIQLMILVMVNTGMRVGELVNFKPNWIDFEERSIRIQENKKPIAWKPKRESMRSVPISSNVLDNLKRHLKNRKTGYVFQSQKTKTFEVKDGKRVSKRTHRRYAYRTIIRKVNKISQEVMGVDTGTHIFRASYASHLLANKMSLEGIRKFLGHSDIKTTLVYIRSIPDFSEWEKVRNMEFMQMDLGNILKI